MSEFETRAPYPQATQLFVGAASPLWGFFAGAAAGGLALWWATRWAQPANLEAFWGKRSLDAAQEPMSEEAAVVMKAMEPMVAAVEAIEEPAVEFMTEVEEAAESAAKAASEMGSEPLPPLAVVSAPAVEAAATSGPERDVEPPAETASFAPPEEPVAPAVTDAAPTEPAKGRRKGGASFEPPPEPPVE